MFILTACRVFENKGFRIVRVLMFPVAALIMKSFSFLSSIEKFTSDFHGKFYAKNRCRMNQEARKATSVFPVKLTLQFISLTVIFFLLPNEFYKKTSTPSPSEWKRKKKCHFRVNCQ